MRILKERLYTEEELGNLEQREYGLLRRVKATVGRARRNVAKKIEEKIDKNLEELSDANAKIRHREDWRAPKGSYRALEQIKKDVRREQPDVYFTNKMSKGMNVDGAFYLNRKNLSKEVEKKIHGIPKYANHMIFNGKNPNAGTTLHEVGHMKRALGKEGTIAKFINKISKKKELNPTDLIDITGGNGKLLNNETYSINRGGIINNVKDISHYVLRWLEERGANKYSDKELKRLLKEGKISKEIYDRGREMTKLSMDTYTPSTKINILSSIKNTMDIPSHRGRFDLNYYKN